MRDGPTRLHIITERDVGMFSLIQQVVAQIPWALAEKRIPVVYFRAGTCYWTPKGYRGADTVWEYYFEPVDSSYPAARIPDSVRAILGHERPTADEVGYLVAEGAFVSSHFGDHCLLRGLALPIPYRWDDPSDGLRREAKVILDSFVRPRSYLAEKVDDFYARLMAGRYVVGVHARGTDATSTQEIRPFRQGSLVLSRYLAEIERILEVEPTAKLFVASDDQSSVDHLAAEFPQHVIAYDTVRHRGGEVAGQGPTGWIMPAYVAGDRDLAAKNGEDAIIEYLLLSRCRQLVHNGSSLARTVLLNAPDMPHVNTHRRPPALAEADSTQHDGRPRVRKS